jgi:GNAT superfamily N-acetyltransferase
MANPLKIRVERALPGDAAAVALMVGDLLDEISKTTGVKAFDFELNETALRARGFLEQEKYVVFLGREGRENVGFIALCESVALYAGGVFGTIPELYVRADYRSLGFGDALVAKAKEYGLLRGWKRLEVTTPPLPHFERTLRFYERHGFSVSGGRKLKLRL